jgi:hypothetical protein
MAVRTAPGLGLVYLTLPDDGYIQLTPEQARQIGGRLFIKAAEAEGVDAPSIVALEVAE